MKEYDLMIIGPASKDINIDYDGSEDRCIGGAVTFATPSAAAVTDKVFAAVKIAPEDQYIIDGFHMNPEDIALLPSKETTSIQNVYTTETRETRDSKCISQSGEITIDQIPDVPCKLYHLAGLLYGDFSNQLMEQLSKKGKVAIDIQGMLRHNDNGEMVFHDWAEKKEYLKYIDFLKTDAKEAEILTGTTDREKAAHMLCDWGAKEVLISHNTEMIVYDGKKLRRCPVKARNLSGRTGRGDTTTGAYLAMRITGNSIEDSLLYATACVSLKMEKIGVFSGTRKDVEDYINQFYK